MEYEINHLEKEGKFSALIDGHESMLRYRKEDDDTLNFFSTYVPAELRGRGVAVSRQK